MPCILLMFSSCFTVSCIMSLCNSLCAFFSCLTLLVLTFCSLAWAYYYQLCLLSSWHFRVPACVSCHENDVIVGIRSLDKYNLFLRFPVFTDRSPLSNQNPPAFVFNFLLFSSCSSSRRLSVLLLPLLLLLLLLQLPLAAALPTKVSSRVGVAL